MINFDLSAIDEPQAPLVLRRFDADGIEVPDIWGLPQWEKQALSVRQKLSARFVAERDGKKPKVERPRRAYRPPFTTTYAIKWGRSQGWKLIERERYDHRLKRHQDLEGAVDAIFDDGGDGRIGVQGAGKGEREAHWRKFIAWGGPEKARRRHLKVFYLEFERGSFEPIKQEQWA